MLQTVQSTQFASLSRKTEGGCKAKGKRNVRTARGVVGAPGRTVLGGITGGAPWPDGDGEVGRLVGGGGGANSLDDRGPKPGAGDLGGGGGGAAIYIETQSAADQQQQEANLRENKRTPV